MSNIRELSFNSVINYIKQSHGEEDYRKVLDLFPEDEQKIITAETLSMQWKPVNVFIDLLSTVEKIYGKGDNNICYSIGRYAAENEFEGFFRVFLEKGNPKTIIKRASLTWRTIVETGELEAKIITDNYAKVILRDFQNSHKCFCRYLTGYFQKVIELSEAKNVEIKETQCVNNGEDLCVFEATWKNKEDLSE